ncbi:decaprenyl-phosphate phosphoribosyltransferase [Synergistales bacterium]|nr:decaprenyl-phosphate phosphoribosyltransferase [Synergistales bacterium]
MSVNPYIRIARPDHWVKNIFIIPGVVFAIFLTKTSVTAGLLFHITLGFLATSLVASANYVINEWLDAEFDRFHPVKKNRAVVSGSMSVQVIVMEYFLFAAVGTSIAAFVSLHLALSEFFLLIMGVVYNVKPMRTKDIPYVDVLSESVNNAIRLLLGWFLVTDMWLPPVSLVIGYWMGGAFLMAIKRYAEYRMIGNPQTAGQYRKSFQKYDEVSLLVSSVFYALVSIFFVGVFLIKYRLELILTIPFLCGLYCVYLKLSYEEDSVVQKPEKLYRERGLMLYIIFLISLFVLLLLFDIPGLSLFLDKSLLRIPS